VVEVDLPITGRRFQSASDVQNRFVDGDPWLIVFASAPVAESDDLLLVSARDDRLELLREEQEENRVPEHAALGELGIVQPRCELPRTSQEGFAVASLQRTPFGHGVRKKTDLRPDPDVVPVARVDDPRSE